jgi:hypothetical protein
VAAKVSLISSREELMRLFLLQLVPMRQVSLRKLELPQPPQAQLVPVLVEVHIAKLDNVNAALGDYGINHEAPISKIDASTDPEPQALASLTYYPT